MGFNPLLPKKTAHPLADQFCYTVCFFGFTQLYFVKERKAIKEKK